MSISPYIKEIGRGQQGARALSREQACDLMQQVLSGRVSDLELGAFCLAMRIKGETPEELAGFLDAVHAQLPPVVPTQPSGPAPVVIPSYNGARKLPLLTPLLALLLAQRGLPVLVHSHASEDARVSIAQVWAALGVLAHPSFSVRPGQVSWLPTRHWHPGLARLLDVRRIVGLRNPAHSFVKLMSPVQGPSVLVSSYTHPEYLYSMSQTLALLGSTALLLRGTEGEAVADPRRTPAMDGFWPGAGRTEGGDVQGQMQRLDEGQTGSLAQLPDLPSIDPVATAAWIQSVLNAQTPVPQPIARQVVLLEQLSRHGHAVPFIASVPPSLESPTP